MNRRLVPLMLLLVAACTGVRPAPTLAPPASLPVSASAGPAGRLSTALDLEVGPSEYVGSFRASGTLTDQTGRPVSGAVVRVALTPLEGRGTLESYTLTGSVPRTASMASAGLRVNTECGCNGEADVALYDIVYEEGGSPMNSVPNGDFAKRLKGWALGGSTSPQVGKSDLGTGSMLQVKASPRQSLSADSPRFGVEPGQRFTVTFDARVAPASTGSGFFSLVFWGRSGEVSRERILFSPASFALGTRTTDASGAFRATFHPPGAELPLGRVRIDVRFDGDQQLLPATASGTIFVH